jgi:ankyrin repeat protein
MKMNDVSIVVAAKQNNLRAVIELLDMNVDADSTNERFNGEKALHYAIKNNNYDMVKWLIAEGANLIFKNEYNSVLDCHLHICFLYYDRQKIKELLIKCGARFEGEK